MQVKYVKSNGHLNSIRIDDSFYIKENGYGINIIPEPEQESEDDEDWGSFNVTYKHNTYDWEESSYWNDCEDSKFPELKVYHDEIIRYIVETKDMRSKLGMSSTITLGLISEPGMGKSTLIRMLCTTLKKSIFIVENKFNYNFDLVSEGVLVLEDYDRFDMESKSYIENIINELLYTCTSSVPLIIYTSNTSLGKNTDLIYRFKCHDLSTYQRSVDILFENRQDIAELLYNSHVSMREANALLCNAFASSTCPLEYIKNNIGVLKLSSNELQVDYDDEWY